MEVNIFLEHMMYTLYLLDVFDETAILSFCLTLKYFHCDFYTVIDKKDETYPIYLRTEIT